MPELFSWVELQTADLDKAKGFYKGLFDWNFEEVAMPEGNYTMVNTGSEPVAGMMQNQAAEAPSQWMPYIKVEDVDAVTAKALALGAKSVVEPTDIPTGRFSIVIDPAGAAIGFATG